MTTYRELKIKEAAGVTSVGDPRTKPHIDATTSVHGISDTADIVMLNAENSGDLGVYINDGDNQVYLEVDASGAHFAVTDQITFDTAYVHVGSDKQVTIIGDQGINLTGAVTVTGSLSHGANAVATEAYADSVAAAAAAAVVDSAPATLNTLNELAAALGNDEDYAASVATTLGLKAPLESPAFTGTPTVNSETLATEAYADAAAAAIVDLAPKTAVLARSASGTVHFDSLAQDTLYFTNAASGNWMVNIRGNSVTTFSSTLSVGASLTVVFLVTQGPTAFTHSGMSIDGIFQEVTWQSESVPPLGSPNGVDGFTFTIIKTSPSTYFVLGRRVSFEFRSLSSGQLDSEFTIGTGASDTVTSIAVQPDGKILVGGSFTSWNGATANRLARLNPDGTVDSAFTIGTGASDRINSIAVQSDGKILVGGFFTSWNGAATGRLVRLNPDGTVNSAFTIGTGASDRISSIAVQSDGKILVGGNFTSWNGAATGRLVRLNPDGSLDSAFTIGTGASSNINSIAVQSDGKILVGGNFTSWDGAAAGRLVRLNPDGTVDSTFTIGTGASSNIYSIAVQPDGKILVGDDRPTVRRLNPDGTLDLAITLALVGTVARVSSIAVQPDGKILVGGIFAVGALRYFLRLSPDGTVDSTFTIGTGGDSVVSSIAVQSDGKILVGGNFTSWDGAAAGRLVRLGGT